MSETAKKPFPIEPTAGRVVIRYVKAAKKSSIIKPGDDEILQNVGEVVAISTDRPTKARVGCRVVYNQGASLPVTVNGEEFRVLNEDGICAYFVADPD